MKLAQKLMRLLPGSVRHALIRRASRPDERELAGLEVRIASSVDEYLEAAKLVHDAYVSRGIMQSHGSGVRMTPFLALPSTIVFVAPRNCSASTTCSVPFTPMPKKSTRGRSASSESESRGPTRRSTARRLRWRCG